MASIPSFSSVAASAVELDVNRVHEDYADFVWRTLQRLGVVAQDLEDALQEVFVVVHKKLTTFDHSSRLSTWLFGICLRVAAAQRRRAYRRREELVSELEERLLADPGSDPEQSLLRQQAAARLELVLASLTLERRAVFVMFEIEGIAAPAIAEMLGVPVGTVYSRLSTARAEFTQAVARLERRDGKRGSL
ncbi:MAG: sigma-70 family RNA polymerase sigma factor [Polyangiaceae bacterium]